MMTNTVTHTQQSQPTNTSTAGRRVRAAGGLLALGLFAAIMVASGVSKLTGAMDAQLGGLGVPLWSIPILGVLASAGGIGLLLRPVRPAAALGLTTFFVGAVATHALNGDWAGIGVPAVFLVWAAALAYTHRPARFRTPARNQTPTASA